MKSNDSIQSLNMCADKYECRNSCGEYFSTDRSRKRHENYYCRNISELDKTKLNITTGLANSLESNLATDISAGEY